MGLEEKRQQRTLFMRWLYDKTDGSEHEVVESQDFAVEGEGLPDTITYLEGEGLLKAHWTLGGEPPSVQITHPGVVEMEQALSRPHQATEHLSPMVNITHVYGNVVGSQIQQGSPGATQNAIFGASERLQIEEFINAVKANLPGLGLDAEASKEVSETLGLIETQMAKPQPSRNLVRELGKSVGRILEGAAGGLAATGILGMPVPWT